MFSKERLFTGFTILASGFLMFSCSQATEGREDDSDTKVEVEAEVVEEGSSITVSEFPASNAFEDAVLRGGKYRNGNFIFKVNNYDLGAQTEDAGVKMCANSDKGQHIHLIVDDKPYAASYGKLMMWFFLITDTLTFSAFLAAYGFSRFKYPEVWPVPEDVFTLFPFLHG